MRILPPARSPSQPRSETNSLLRALPEFEYQKVMAEASFVRLTQGQELVRGNEKIDYVWFPQAGMVSLVKDLDAERTSIEVGSVGREGVVGLPVAHGVLSQSSQAIVQASGEATRIPAAAFGKALDECPVLWAIVQRYTIALLSQVLQLAACNRMHTLEQRCAKWMLTTHDHMDGSELRVTQEILALMLGVRRPGVTVAAQALASAGLITYRRGRITVVDRVGLEKVSCECYQKIRDDYEKLLGDVMIPPGTVPGPAMRLLA